MSNTTITWALAISAHYINHNPMSLLLYKELITTFRKKVTQLTQYLTDTPLTTEEGIFSKINHFNQPQSLNQKAHSLIHLKQPDAIQQLETTYDEIINSSAGNSKVQRKRMPNPSGTYPNLSTGR